MVVLLSQFLVSLLQYVSPHPFVGLLAPMMSAVVVAVAYSKVVCSVKRRVAVAATPASQNRLLPVVSQLLFPIVVAKPQRVVDANFLIAIAHPVLVEQDADVECRTIVAVNQHQLTADVAEIELN